MLSPSRLLKTGLALGLLLTATAPSLAASETPATNPSAIEMIESAVAQIVMSDLQRLQGEYAATTCVETAERSFCLAADTPPEVVEELLRKLPTWVESDGGRYIRQDRWTTTASGYSGILGDPITLSYSYIPDGTYIPAEGEASTLFSVMNAQFSGDTEAWKQIFRECFDRWATFIGITYIEEPNDDGAAFPNSVGILGVRGDSRIGMANIDGGSNVLAYTYYPSSGGDMVFDSSENWAQPGSDYRFLRNVTMHEHGHCQGLAHCDASNNQLMEAYYNGAFYGPQDDDIRGGMRNYGDYLEKNSTIAEATDWGILPAAPFMQENVSLTASNDSDYYKFTLASPMLLDVIMTPIGSYYILEGVAIYTNQIMNLGFELRSGDGTTILTTINDGAEGVIETLTDYELAAGDYWLRVRRFAGNDVQRYRLNLDLTATVTAVGEAGVPAKGLGLSVFPTPFNPKTTARFYVREAGSVSLEIFNVQGRRIQAFRQEAAGGEWLQVSWNGQDEAGAPAPSGLYFLRAASGGESETVRALLLK
jgi:hypothetical protein